jgi:hypothetical protein
VREFTLDTSIINDKKGRSNIPYFREVWQEGRLRGGLTVTAVTWRLPGEPFVFPALFEGPKGVPSILFSNAGTRQ